MKTYQKLICAGALGLASLVSYNTILGEPKQESAKNECESKYTEEKWEMSEIEKGIMFHKEDKKRDVTMWYKLYFLEYPYVDRPKIELEISKNNFGNITITDDSYMNKNEDDTCTENKIDGNINDVSLHLYNKNLSAWVEFTDTGIIRGKSSDIEKYFKDMDLKKILPWANKKLKEVQDNLREEIGDKMNIPKPEDRYRELQSIDDILKGFE